MDAKIKEGIKSFANTNLWDVLRDELIKPLADEYKDVSRPFRYGDTELQGPDAYYAKVGATESLKELIKIINTLKRSKPVKSEDFE